MSPQRIKLSRKRGWRKPPGAVVVSRPGRWGNPYSWQDVPSTTYGPDGEPSAVPDAERRRLAVANFAEHLAGNGIAGYPTVEEIRTELGGRDLACWCPPGQPCHADVLLTLAAGETP